MHHHDDDALKARTEEEIRQHALRAMDATAAMERLVAARTEEDRADAMVAVAELGEWGALYLGAMLKLIADHVGQSVVLEAGQTTLRILGGDRYRDVVLADFRAAGR